MQGCSGRAAPRERGRKDLWEERCVPWSLLLSSMAVIPIFITPIATRETQAVSSSYA